MRRRTVPLLAIALGGCAADPSVRYVEASSPQAVAQAGDRLIDSFDLQRNDIHIELRNNAAAGKPPDLDLEVTDMRAEEPELRLMMLRDDKLWTRTSVSLAKVENSDLIDSAGVAVEDRRAELIQTAGAAAKLFASIAPAAGPDSGPREEIKRFEGCGGFPERPCDLMRASEVGVPRAAQKESGPSGLWVTWGPVPATAIPISEFKEQLTSRHVHGLYYSACRSLEISFTYFDLNSTPVREIDFRWKGKIADPRWVDFVRFPRKGSIRMHSQCGVSISNEGDPTQSNAALIGAAIAQAAAVRQAADASH